MVYTITGPVVAFDDRAFFIRVFKAEGFSLGSTSVKNDALTAQTSIRG
jgi:hypothetical protein